MTIQTDLSGVRDVFHDRMPTNRWQSECALKLPGLRPSSWMLAALAGGGAVDGGLTAMVKVLGGEGFVCVNTWGFKNFDSNQIGSTDIKQSAVAASESALPRAHEVLELTLRVADAPAISVGDRDRKRTGNSRLQQRQRCGEPQCCCMARPVASSTTASRCGAACWSKDKTKSPSSAREAKRLACSSTRSTVTSQSMRRESRSSMRTSPETVASAR